MTVAHAHTQFPSLSTAGSLTNSSSSGFTNTRRPSDSGFTNTGRPSDTAVSSLHSSPLSDDDEDLVLSDNTASSLGGGDSGGSGFTSECS